MHRHGYIGRKMRQPKLQEKPAIIFTAFGSSSRAKAALEIFSAKVDELFGEHSIHWAYSSEIIRKKAGTESLHQALAKVESEGFRRVVVQPLHIFPGTEYQQIAETCEYFPGLRVFLSETLMHRWDFIEDVLEVVEQEFLHVDEGLNILALHGTPLAADPVNIVYQGIERLVEGFYDNVTVSCVEGIPQLGACLKRIETVARSRSYTKVKIIPLMFLAGIHVEDDLMGEEDSWREELAQRGFTEILCPRVTHEGEEYFKGLGFYPEITDFLIRRLRRTIRLAKFY